MNNNYILLDEQTRYELQEIYNKLEKIKKSINYEYEEYVCINTSLELIDRAINYEKKI